MKDKLTTEFIKLIAKIKDPIAFIGIVKILKVELLDEYGKPRAAEDMAADMIKRFSAETAKRRKELVKIIEQAIAAGEEKETANDN